MQFVARVDCPHEDISFDDFYRLSPYTSAQRHGIWRALQTRRWQALTNLLQAFRKRDPETWRHCERVQQYAIDLGIKLCLSIHELQMLKLSALLHDVGKMAISEDILNKEVQLTEEEFCIVRMHSEVGERLVHPLMPHPQVLAGIRHHHERMDGTGYPDQLQGRQIPLIARIISVADVYDALTHVRPYRRFSLTPLEALEVLEVQTTGQLDPDLVIPFSKYLRSTLETLPETRALKA